MCLGVAAGGTWLHLHPHLALVSYFLPQQAWEAKRHRWPSGWHFRTWASAQSQHSPSPTLLCSVALLILQGSDWVRAERLLGRGGQGAQAQDWPMAELPTSPLIRL